MKSPRVTAAPLLLRLDKRAQTWLHRWLAKDIAPLSIAIIAAPWYHLRFTVILSIVAVRIQIAEALRPIVVAQHEADKETRGWEHVLPTAQCVILVASTAGVLAIPSAPPPLIHIFLNMRNSMALQADCSLTYSGLNI